MICPHAATNSLKFDTQNVYIPTGPNKFAMRPFGYGAPEGTKILRVKYKTCLRKSNLSLRTHTTLWGK